MIVNEIKKLIAGTILFLILSIITLPVAASDLSDAFGDKFFGAVGEKAGFNIEQRSIDPVITAIIKMAVGFLGVIFLLLMIYGGYMWMTAQGNEEKVKTAQKLIVAAVIGLLVVVAAYAITYYVLYRFGGLLK